MIKQAFPRLLLSALALVLWTGSAFAADAAKKARPSKGDVPPAYVGHQLAGDDVLLDPKAGKAYVVSFWATWCGYCMKELPILANIQRIAGDKVQVIAINTEERDVYRRVQGAIKDLGITSTYDPGNKAHDAYGVTGIPHMVIVGRDGRITSVRVGYDESSLEGLAAEINQAMAAPLAKAEAN